jgi:hypothetical protein
VAPGHRLVAKHLATGQALVAAVATPLHHRLQGVLQV